MKLQLKRERNSNMFLRHEEVARILKSEKGFDRLFSLFHEKYRSYERVEKGISVVLTKPTMNEKEVIGGLFGEDYSRKQSLRISADKFEKALNLTKFGKDIEHFSFQLILEAYYQKSLTSKREEAETYLQGRSAFFGKYKGEDHPVLLQRILDWAEMNKNNRYYLHYRQNETTLRANLDMLSQLLEMFPLESPVYLPVFSSNVTKNPHTLDVDREEGKFLIYTLQVLREIETGENMQKKLLAEEITELLFSFNILRDDLSNYTTVFNIRGINRNGEENRLLKGAFEEKTTFHLALKDVIKLGSIQAQGNVIFMLENTGLTSYVVNQLIEDEKSLSIMSGNGILTLATLKFLDLFMENGGILYYAGDFDPEGLGIIRRLLLRYGDAVRLMKFTIKDYDNSISDERLSETRLNKLRNETVSDYRLIEIKEKMLQIKRAGYQENILKDLLEYLYNYKF
jgi:uncharacterized protein (TIGR02679 family)